MRIPFDNINQKHFTDIVLEKHVIVIIHNHSMHYLRSLQDIDKALYVAEFHQEEEQEEC